MSPISLLQSASYTTTLNHDLLLCRASRFELIVYTDAD
jgi:hypothetical protein